MKNLEVLKDKIRAAKDEMEEAIKERWPKGSRCECYLNSIQQKPTSGTVVYHNGDGYVLVRIDTAKTRSRRGVRKVYFTDMV